MSEAPFEDPRESRKDPDVSDRQPPEPADPWPEPITRLVLPNGMPVEIHSGLSPTLADVAVCSSDESGNPGELNQFVFESLGVPIDRLPKEFEPPSHTFDAPDGKKIVVVQTLRATYTKEPEEPTDRKHRPWSLTAEGLRHGLQPLVEPEGIERLWVGALGAGAAGLGLADSLRVCLYGLGSLGGMGRFKAAISLPPGEKLPEELQLDHWSRGTPTLIPEPTRFEPHFGEAVLIARAWAGNEPVTARHLIEAVVALAPESSSTAFRALQNFLPAPVPDRPAVHGPAEQPFAASPELALATLGMPDYLRGEDENLWGRDLVALALLSRDPSLDDLARECGTSVASLRDRWLAFVLSDEQAPLDKDVWLAWWRDCGFPTDTLVRRSGYLPELVNTEDKLDVESEAHAFAGLICDESVGPPLSIALLGDWGSGKSFFMNKIKSRVATHNGSPGFCENAVAIEFNAWHMSDANLWASLVDHIFQKLQEAMFGQADLGEAFRAELAKAEGAVHAAAEQVSQAEEGLRQAQNELNDASQGVRRRALRGSLKQAAAMLGVTDAFQSILDVEQAARELNDATDQSRKILGAALRPRALASGLGWVVVSVGAGAALVTFGPVLADALGKGDPAQVTSLLRNLGTVGGMAGSIFGAAAGTLRKASSLVGDLNAEIRQELDGYRAELRVKDSAVSRARTRYEAADAAFQAARAHLQRVEADGGAQDPGRTLRRFISERARSVDYRARQGLRALVRRDFEPVAWLGKRSRDARRDPEAFPSIDVEKWRQEAALVDRVVLYIDDLDRCKPERVVEVLEAVHLLLGLDLFVVIVAVDSRWMLRALEVHYEALLTAEDERDDDAFRESTPQNYLEKIFQIPFALAPMSEPGFEQYVEFLVRDGAERVQDVEARPRVARGGQESEGRADESETDPWTQRDVADDPWSDATPPTAAENETPVQWGRELPDEDRPRIVVITRTEREAMKQLGALLPTPRQAKRLVNVFRLIKLQIDEGRLDDFERPDAGGHRAVLALLAILFGRPNLAHVLFRALFELGAAPTTPTLHAWIDDLGKFLEASSKASDRTIAAEARDAAGLLEARYAGLSVADCAIWVGTVARYSLVTGQEWHTWREGAWVKSLREA